MSELSDRALETQLNRRRAAAPLDHTHRVELIESIHAHSATVGRESGRFHWRWLAGAAIAAALVVVVSIALPRVVTAPGASPSPTWVAPKSIVMSVTEFAAAARDPNWIGNVVLARATLDTRTITERFMRPCTWTSVCPIAVLAGVEPELLVVGNSPASDNSQAVPLTIPSGEAVMAFRVREHDVQYLGRASLFEDRSAWPVTQAVAAAPSEASPELYPVEGWLMRTEIVSCPVPNRYDADTDLTYFCGGSWVTSEPMSTGFHEGLPGALHVQGDAYRDFAASPVRGLAGAGEPRDGVYLVRPAGCPENVVPDCPVWEMVVRLEPPMGESEMPTPEPSASSAPSPTASLGARPTPPADWPASLRNALESTAVYFGLRSGESARVWPFEAGRACPIQPNDRWTYAEQFALVLRPNPDSLDVSLADVNNCSERAIGSYSASTEFSGALNGNATTAYVAGSGDQDNGVVAWDLQTGSQQFVLEPESWVTVRSGALTSPSGQTAVSTIYGCVENDCGAEVITSDGTVRGFSGDITVEAVTDKYVLANTMLDAGGNLGGDILRRVLINIRDGSMRPIPLEADGWFRSMRSTCTNCDVDFASPPQAFALDDTHFVLDSLYDSKYRVYVLDAESNEASAIYGWDDPTGTWSYVTNFFLYTRPLSSTEWLLLTRRNDDHTQLELQAVNVSDGAVVNVGAAR